MEIAGLITAAVLSVLWYLIWTKTYLPYDIKGLIKHSVIFILLSAGILFITANAVFAPVDNSYSYSNKSALGLLFILMAIVFICASIFALAVTIGEYINKDDEYDRKQVQDKNETQV